jgi:hypothetical protein
LAQVFVCLGVKALQRIIAMSATLTDIKCVTIAGIKATWKIPKADQEQAEDITYVKLCGKSSSLRSMVVPKDVPANVTLAQNLGYQAMQKLRNDVQIRELSTDLDNPCNLFGGSSTDAPVQAEIPKSSRKRQSCGKFSAHGKDDGNAHVAIDIVVNDVAQTVNVLRCREARDALYIEYDAETCSTVIAYLRERGFGNSVYTVRDATMPKGIYRRRAKFIAKGSSGKSKMFACVEDAQSFLSNEPTVADDEGSSDEV